MVDDETSRLQTSSFLDKLYTILEEEDPATISWGSTGDSFIIHDPDEFSKAIMRKYFKSSKFNSFVRQLNFYGFRKSTKDIGVDGTNKSWEFKHPFFLRGRKDLLSRIRRKQIGENDGDVDARLLQAETRISTLVSIINELVTWKNDICNRFPPLCSDVQSTTSIDLQSDFAMLSSDNDPSFAYDDNNNSSRSVISNKVNFNSNLQSSLSANYGGLMSVPLNQMSPLPEQPYRNQTVVLPREVFGSNMSDFSDNLIRVKKNDIPSSSLSRPSDSDEFFNMQSKREAYDSSICPSNIVPTLQKMQVSIKKPTAASNTARTIYSQDYFPPKGYLS